MSHNFWFNCWIFKFHTFLETGSQDLSRGIKINLIQGHLKMAALQGLSPQKTRQGYKRPQAPLNQKKKKDFSRFGSLSRRSLHIFPLFQIQKTHKKIHQNLLIVPSSPKIQGIVLIPNLLCFRCLDLLFPICWCLGLHAHMLDIMSPAMPCLDLHVCMHVLCSYTYVYAFTCLYAWICVLPCFYDYIHMLRCTFTCLHAYFHAYMCR